MPAGKKVTPPPKKKSGRFLKIILLIGIFLIFGRYLNFSWDIPYFDILYYLHPPMTFEQTMKLIEPLAPKGYSYPEASNEARNRNINCRDVEFFVELPRSNPLCLNMFRTSPDEITQAVAGGMYDRIILYGQESVFDAPVSNPGDQNYISDLYNTVKFMDRIAIPKFLSSYGLPDVSYIAETKPYPYLYFRISDLDESDRVCHYGDTTEKVQGCARGYAMSIIPLSAVGPQMSDARPILRKTDNKRFSYLTHYPSDCYTNETFAHETAHMLNSAGSADTKASVMDKWLTEQIAGFYGIYGAELACGEGTVTMQKEKIKSNVPQALAQFNATFAPAALSHEYPEDSTCRQAMLTVFYQYLSKGNLDENFKKFFMTLRTSTPSVVEDANLSAFLVKLNPDPSVKSFLTSKGCIL